jgi:hypothetical protein
MIATTDVFLGTGTPFCPDGGTGVMSGMKVPFDENGAWSGSEERSALLPQPVAELKF